MLNINDYRYDLPAEKIAAHPLSNRDASKLLVYRKGIISHAEFHHLPRLLPADAFLFFNNTRVIPARMRFRKETGAEIEIFLLTPLRPSPVLAETMQATEHCTWKCAIGNQKRWRAHTTLSKTIPGGTLRASLENGAEGIVRFEWNNGSSFAATVNDAGETPLPPYLNRAPDAGDRERYQTIYSHHEGAVAAPTAGLHFTDNVLEALRFRNIGSDFLTLHVSAGTFQPVKNENADEHIMHAEQIVVSRSNVENLLRHENIIAVGTTSMRTLESIYWFGARLLAEGDSPFVIGQDDPYRHSRACPPVAEAIAAVKAHMARSGADTIAGSTAIFIKPGYSFRICKGLITNFHQPASTLILLVAAFAGPDWRRIYDEALTGNYRFLSYGDSSLLLP